MQSTNCGNKSAIIPQAIFDNHHEVVDLHSTIIIALVTTQAVAAPDDKDFNTQLNEIDAELAKCDSIEESNFNSNNINPHATIIDQSHDNLKDSHDP